MALMLAHLVYRLSLRLLPQYRRGRYGDEMRDVFRSLATDARHRAGALGVWVLLMKEVRGLMTFALRERLHRLSDGQPSGGRWRPLRELHWAWRGVRARGWPAMFIVVLLAATLGANAVVFSVADSLAFTRVGYDDPESLVVLQGYDPKTGQTITGLPSDLIAPWRAHSDLFMGVHGQTGGTVLLNRQGEPLAVRAAWVTPGLLEMLGAAPLRGRLFAESDRGTDASTIAIVREDLAREYFGDPDRAVGQILDAATGSLRVVGVLPTTFRFPSGNDRIWRPRDLAGSAGARISSLFVIARVAPGVTPERLRAALAERSPAITPQTALARGWPYLVAAAPLVDMYGAAPVRVFWFLIGAAVCLLLTACASIASIELASAVARARTYAIATALGATRASLVRIVLIEAALLVGCAAVIAWGLASVGTAMVATGLPDSVTFRSTNAIDLDRRGLLFMIAAGAMSWIVAALPIVVFASRQPATSVLKHDGRTGTASRGAAMARRALTALQVAVAVCLLIGATLGLRSYLALVTLDKGFDSTNLVSLRVTVPPSMPRTGGAIEVTTAQVLERLRGLPTVVSATSASDVPPAIGGERHAGPLEIEGRGDPAGMAILTRMLATPDYFAVLRLPLRAGRLFAPGDPRTAVIVSESFAHQFWPHESAVGRRFRQQGDREWFEIVGVAARVRSEFDQLGQPSRVEYEVYVHAAPASLTADATAPPTGREALFWTLAFPVRVTDLSALPSVLQAVRAIDPRLLVKADIVNDQYRALTSDTRAATWVVTSFGVLAFVVALAGVYGVMAFLVAGRGREIAIRMALGADRGAVGRQVLGSALRFVVVGAATGLGGAWAASRLIASQLFGVSPTDAATYVGVALAVVLAAVVATWQPARRAAGTDPAIALRAE